MPLTVNCNTIHFYVNHNSSPTKKIGSSPPHILLLTVDCDVGPWGAWSTCSATCGLGTKNRTRKDQCFVLRLLVYMFLLRVNIADAKHNGEKCAKTKSRIIELAETEICHSVCSPPGKSSEKCAFNLNFISVDCDVGPWGSWTSCSLTCGGGNKTRTRFKQLYRDITYRYTFIDQG